MGRDEEKLIDEPMTKKDKVLLGTILGVASVVLIVLIAAIAMVLLKPAVGKSPESAFQSMIDGLDSGDFMEVYDASVFSLNMSYSEFKSNVGDMFDSEYDIVVKNVNVVTKDNMDQSDKDDAEGFIPQLEDMIGKHVEDYCMIEFTINITVKGDGEPATEDSTGSLICVQIDSKWYLVFPILEEGGGTPTVYIAVSNIPNGVVLNIDSISDSDVSWGEVDIILTDGGTWVAWHPNAGDLMGPPAVTFNYSSQSFGTLLVNCSLTDIAGNGGINGGDYIVLTTSEGTTNFTPGVTYTVTMVYKPTSEEMGRIQFVG